MCYIILANLKVKIYVIQSNPDLRDSDLREFGFKGQIFYAPAAPMGSVMLKHSDLRESQIRESRV